MQGFSETRLNYVMGREHKEEADTNGPYVNYMVNLTNQTSFDHMYRQLKISKNCLLLLPKSIRFNEQSSTKYRILLWVLMIANNFLAKWSV